MLALDLSIQEDINMSSFGYNLPLSFAIKKPFISFRWFLRCLKYWLQEMYDQYRIRKASNEWRKFNNSRPFDDSMSFQQVLNEISCEDLLTYEKSPNVCVGEYADDPIQESIEHIESYIRGAGYSEDMVNEITNEFLTEIVDHCEANFNRNHPTEDIR